jgi:hypothetical protein
MKYKPADNATGLARIPVTDYRDLMFGEPDNQEDWLLYLDQIKWDQAETVRRARAAGVSVKTIAMHLNVGKERMYKIIRAHERERQEHQGISPIERLLKTNIRDSTHASTYQPKA